MPRRGEPGSLRALVDSARPSALRLDLGAALATAQGVLDAQQLPGEIVLLSDLQATAVSAADIHSPVLIGRPRGAAIPNRGISRVDPGPEPWSPGSGRVTVAVTGDSGGPLPATLRLGDRPPRQLLVAPGAPGTAVLNASGAGWLTVEAELDPDELLADNRRLAVVRVAPVARATWPGTSGIWPRPPMYWSGTAGSAGATT